tara:strand:+ start:201 stop:449 length:249 start_codon:yes stop_codon:yes gene_type:complete
VDFRNTKKKRINIQVNLVISSIIKANQEVSQGIFGDKIVLKMLYICCTQEEIKKPHISVRLDFVGGPTWARTRDPLIMSQVL